MTTQSSDSRDTNTPNPSPGPSSGPTIAAATTLAPPARAKKPARGEGGAAAPTPRDSFKVIALATPTPVDPPRQGRKPRLEMPPMPREMFDGMSDLERQHYWFFVQSTIADYNITTPSAIYAVHMAGFDHVNLMRVQASQIVSHELLTAARQHPAVQLRATLDALAATRKQHKQEPAAEADPEQLAMRAGMRRISGA